MFTVGRYSALVGGLLGVALTLALLALPVMGGCSVTASQVNGGPQVVTSSCTSGSLIETQGGHLELVTWAYLFTMAAASAGAALLGWRATRARARAGVILLLGLILLGGWFIAGFSVGPFYTLTVILVLLGSVLIGAGAARSRSTRPSSVSSN